MICLEDYIINWMNFEGKRVARRASGISEKFYLCSKSRKDSYAFFPMKKEERKKAKVALIMKILTVTLYHHHHHHHHHHHQQPQGQLHPLKITVQ